MEIGVLPAGLSGTCGAMCFTACNTPGRIPVQASGVYMAATGTAKAAYTGTRDQASGAAITSTALGMPGM